MIWSKTSEKSLKLPKFLMHILPVFALFAYYFPIFICIQSTALVITEWYVLAAQKTERKKLRNFVLRFLRCFHRRWPSRARISIAGFCDDQRRRKLGGNKARPLLRASSKHWQKDARGEAFTTP